jgi:hypothetical protein
VANINVRKRLERVASDLDAVVKHVALYSGVDPQDALHVDNVASGICAQAARLAEIARHRQGIREPEGALQRRIRKALGFTHP